MQLESQGTTLLAGVPSIEEYGTKKPYPREKKPLAKTSSMCKKLQRWRIISQDE